MTDAPLPVLAPADVDWSQGLPRSVAFGDVFHSRDGGPGQARAVFLGGCGLPEGWRGRHRAGTREAFTLLETGFGGGTNFLATWAAWRDDHDHGRVSGRLTYIACERHPWRPADLLRLHGGGDWDGLARELVAAWPVPVAGFHARDLDRGRVRLLLLLGDAGTQLASLRARVDAFYLDGFAPDRNPEIWQPALLARLGQLAAPGAVAASYTVAASVRAGLAAAGFDAMRRAGFGRKRHALVARFVGRAPAAPDRVAPTPPRAVTVLGGGVAGLSIAEACARRGLGVTLADPAGCLLAGASGNPRAVARPWWTRADTPATRLTRAAFGFARHAYAGHAGGDWQATGALQLPHEARARGGDGAEPFPGAGDPATWGLPERLDQDAASHWAGVRLPAAAWLDREAGFLSPAGWAGAIAGRPGIETRLGRPLDLPALLAGSEAVVVACGMGSNAYLAHPLPLHRTRGQVTLLPAGSLPGLRAVVARNGYAVPLPAGAAMVGATYDRHDDPEPDAAGHRANLERLAGLVASPPGLDPAGLAGRAALRAVLPGRLPALGLVAGGPGAGPGLPHWLATGYASRGWVWAPLLAELLLARMLGETWPLEAELAAAIAPDRFLPAAGA